MRSIRTLIAPYWSDGEHLWKSLLANRLVRSAALVVLYCVAFFPMSAVLPGAAANTASIIPVVIIASWLGTRGGVLVALGFIPLLAVLTSIAQNESLIFLALEGRSVALISLVAMAAVAGRVGEFARTHAAEREISQQRAEAIEALYLAKEKVETEQKQLVKRLAAQNRELRTARERMQESEAQLQERNAELQSASDAKNTFLSSVTHELKTPLSIVIGFTELLGTNANGNLTQEQLEQLCMVERNGRHLDRLVNDLVDVNRIESGRFTVNLELMDPEALLNETLDGLETITADKSQIVRKDFDLRRTMVKADRARLKQVITNLVTNASKYSPNDSVINVGASIENSALILIVADNGLGISREDQKKLFTPFFRSTNEDAQRENGTGLGLAITQSIIEMHCGSLELESALGKGTYVRVRIPGAAAPERYSSSNLKRVSVA